MEQIKVSATLLPALQDAGFDVAAVLRRAGLSPAFWSAGTAAPEQVVRLWAALGELASDPAFALKLPRAVPPEKSHPAFIAAQHSRDFRDGLARFSRYKLLCCGEEIGLEEREGECRISFEWPRADIPGPLPRAFIDVVFSSTLELGRRGTQRDLHPLRVELARSRFPDAPHEAHYGCPVRWGARRNLLVFRKADLDLPFATYNAELLALLGPPLDAEVARRKAARTVSEKVRWVVARSLEKGRLEIADIAREIGLGSRTLQRRIAEEGTTFRRLVDETRRERARHYLGQPALALGEAAFLLGYEDPNSFFRAFSRWEGRTPGAWRASRGNGG